MGTFAFLSKFLSCDSNLSPGSSSAAHSLKSGALPRCRLGGEYCRWHERGAPVGRRACEVEAAEAEVIGGDTGDGMHWKVNWCQLDALNARSPSLSGFERQEVVQCAAPERRWQELERENSKRSFANISNVRRPGDSDFALFATGFQALSASSVAVAPLVWRAAAVDSAIGQVCSGSMVASTGLRMVSVVLMSCGIGKVENC